MDGGHYVNTTGKEIEMFIYKISQKQNDNYDTYDSAVVVARSAYDARNMNPSTGDKMTEKDWNYRHNSWCNSPDLVTVECIGASATLHVAQYVVCSSFNAG